MIRACLLIIFALEINGIHTQLLPTIPSMKQIIGWPSDPEPKQQNSTSNSNIKINYQTGCITLTAVNATYNYAQGTDGRVVCFPSHWRRVTGNDGRIVAYPTNWRYSEGNDGRIVAYPPSNWRLETDLNERIFFIPYSGWTLEKGSDGYWSPRPINGWLSKCVR